MVIAAESNSLKIENINISTASFILCDLDLLIYSLAVYNYEFIVKLD